MRKHLPSTSFDIHTWGPAGIAGIYLVLGVLWILFSDQVVSSIAPDQETFTRISTYKGWGYVVVTALFLYFLIRRHSLAMLDNQKQLHTLTDALPALISYIDSDKYYRFNNKAYQDWFGNKATGQHVQDVLGVEVFLRISKYINKALSGEIVQYEAVLPYKDGGERYVNAAYIPDTDSKGTTRGFFVLVQDMTERMQAEKEHQLWANAFEGCAHGISVSDPVTNRILACNPAFANMHRHAVDDVIGASALELYAPSDRKYVQDQNKKSDQIGHVHFTANKLHKDGSVFNSEIDVVSVRGEGGEILYRVITTRDITENKVAEDALVRSESRYRSLFENMTSGFARCQMLYAGDGQPDDFIYLDVNHAFKSMTGLKGVVGRRVTDVIPNIRETNPEIFEIYGRVASTGIPEKFETYVPNLGSGIWFLVSAYSPEKDFFVAVFETITERKQAEDALRRNERILRLFVEHAPAEIAMFDLHMNYVAASRRYMKDYRLQQDDIIGRSHYEIFPEISEKWKEIHRRCLAGKVEFCDADPFPRADGTLDWIKWEIHPWYENENTIGGIILMSEVITERKKAEDALKNNEKRFRALIEHGMDNISLLTADGKLLWENPAIQRTLGYPQDGYVGRNIFELMHPDDLGWVSELFAKLVQEPGSSRQGIFRLQHASSTWRWMEATATNLLNEPSVQAVVVNYRDITERKTAEDALRESEDRLVQALAGAKMSVWEWNLKTDRISWSPEFFELNSQNEANETFDSFTHLIHPDDADHVRESAKRAIKENKLFAEEFRILRPNGDIRWLSNLGHADYDSKHDNLRLIGTIQDVTERRQAEQALHTSEQRYRDLFEHSPISIWEEDFSQLKKHLDSLKAQGITDFHRYFEENPEEVLKCSRMIRILDANESALKMYKAESKNVLFQVVEDELSEGEMEHILEDIIAVAEGRMNNHWSGADKTLTGEPLEISLSWSVASGQENDYSKVIVTTVDITERHKIEQALLESTAQFRTLFEASPDAIMLVDTTDDWSILDCNTAACRMNGYTRDELVGQSVNILNLTPGLLSERGEYMNRIKQTDVLRYETFHRRKDGTVFPIEVSTSLIRLGGSDVVLGIDRDITERKQKETELRISEERFLQLADNIQEVFWITDSQTGKELYISPAAETIWGRSVESLMNNPDTFLGSIHQEDISMVQTAIDRERNGEKVELEYRVVRQDGSERWIWDRAFPIFDDQGEVIRVAGIAADITERKLADDRLRESEERYRQLLNVAPVGVGVHVNGRLVFVNAAAARMVGAQSPDELIGKPVMEFVHPDERESTVNVLRRMLMGEKGLYPREERFIRLDGSIVNMEVIATPLNYMGKSAVQVIIQDITERMRAENEINRHLAELEALYENGLAVGRLLEPREIGNRVISTFAHHLSWHHVTIRLLKEGSDELELVAYSLPHSDYDHSDAEQNFNFHISKSGQGLSGWAIQTGKPLRTGNVQEYPQYVNTYEGIQSGLYMPLTMGERVIGVIGVESEQPDAFTYQDERLLATLASQAAVAFENARLYQTLQQELSERRRIETALRSSETHYRDLANSITDVMFELDHDLHYTHWNKAAEALTGISAENAMGRSMREIFGDTEEQAKIEKVYLDVLAERHSRTFETALTVDGQQNYFELNAYPSMRGVSVVAKNITERKWSEKIMQKRFELMEYSAHHSLAEVSQRVTDEVSELTKSEVAFLQFMDADQTTPSLQIWSTRASELMDAIGEQGHLNVEQAGVWSEAVRQRRPVIHNDYESLSNKNGLPEGHIQIVREVVFPIIRNETIVGVIGVGNKPQDYTQHDLESAERFTDYAWDIIERKQMEISLADERNQLAKRVDERTTDLIHANANLARALRVKDEFLANMSHELRTPLNAILGLSESLAEQIAGPLNDKQSKYINTISESGHHLLSLINDILDLAKIEAGQITLDITTIDIRSVCEASIRMVKQQAQKKNQELVLEIDENIGLMWADERRLKQMMVNLLSNAVKFTPENEKFGLKIVGNEQENKVTITVWDNGIGISEDDLSKLFQPFMQLDSGLARESTGTGLGLALVAQMARLHGGSVTVESNIGSGSRFSIFLPWEPALAADTVEKMRTTGKFRAVRPDMKNKQTILLVEDTQEVVMMIRDYLELAGYNVVTAEDGLDAIEQAKLTHPDLILMDVQMPRMNGLEATQKLRSEARFKYTPIIALTALAMPSDRERCLAAGMDDYVTKPINLRGLVKLIQNCLSRREQLTIPR